MGQKTLADQLPDYIIDHKIVDFLKYHGAKEDDIRNWITTNETTLNQLENTHWVIGPYNNFLYGESLGSKRIIYYIFWNDNKNTANEIPIAYLKGSGRIKPLLVYQYMEEAQTPSQAHSKIIGHFGFLVPVIEKITNIQDYDRLKKMTEDFVYANWGLLHKIRSQFKQEPRELGRGEDGIAFGIGKDRVLKLFASRGAYNAAVNAMQRLWKHPETAGTEAMIYDAGAFKPFKDDFNSITIYYYIIERMTASREVIRKSDLGSLLMYIDSYATRAKNKIETNWSTFKSDPSVGGKIAIEIREASAIIDKEIREEHPDLIASIEEQAKSKHLKSNWLAKLAEEIIWKLLTGRTDLHSGNLGITPQGYFRYFDPSYQED